MKYVCTWCGESMREDDTSPVDGLSYGICSGCMGGGRSAWPVDRVTDLDRASADRLPFGLIVLDTEGVVVGYNQAEADLTGLAPSAVIGKAFFRDVAPCTSVKDFRGRFEDLVERGRTATERFTFLFRFKDGSKLVRISMSYDAEAARTAVLVSENRA